MARDIPAALDTALDDRFLLPVFFVELDFDTTPVYLHTDIGPITVLTHTWLGAGGLGSISPIEESETAKAVGLKLRLQITDESSGSIFEELLTQDFYQRTAVIYFSERDIATGSLKADPFELFRGKCDVPEITHGHGESFVDLLIESEFADGQRAKGDLYSDAQLQSEFSGDLGFEFLASMVNARIGFGTSRTSNLAGGASPPDGPESGPGTGGFGDDR